MFFEDSPDKKPLCKYDPPPDLTTQRTIVHYIVERDPTTLEWMDECPHCNKLLQQEEIIRTLESEL
jgi:hypothetical protein